MLHFFIHWFIQSPIHSFIHSFIYSFFHLSIHPFIHSFVHPLIYSSNHLFIVQTAMRLTLSSWEQPGWGSLSLEKGHGFHLRLTMWV